MAGAIFRRSLKEVPQSHDNSSCALLSGFPALRLYSTPGSPCADARLLQLSYSQSHTRRAYLEAIWQFSLSCSEIGIADLAQVEPVHVAAFVEAQLRLHSNPQ